QPARPKMEKAPVSRAAVRNRFMNRTLPTMCKLGMTAVPAGPLIQAEPLEDVLQSSCQRQALLGQAGAAAEPANRLSFEAAAGGTRVASMFSWSGRARFAIWGVNLFSHHQELRRWLLRIRGASPSAAADVLEARTGASAVRFTRSASASGRAPESPPRGSANA